MMLEPGTLLADRYRIVRLIGVGGMGAVFEAENIVTHKRVAIKWLQPLIADRPEAAARLLREAQAASRIRHPNVVDVYDVVRDGETLFLVLELLEGEPLEHVFERESLSLPQLLRVLADAMRGVSAAHKQGVIHRDLHPGNIFVMRQPDSDRHTSKVLDFGISKFANTSGMDITQPGMTLGTPLYMSFEQLRGEGNVDLRADVYSFGVILYEALTGRLPFEAGSLPELAIKFATSVPTAVRALRPSVPESLDRVIGAALARDRDQRLNSVEPMIREVEAFAAVLESRTKSAEDLLGISDDPPPNQIMTLGRQVTPMRQTVPANDVSLSIAAERRFRMSWTVTLLGALAAAALSAAMVIAVRGARRHTQKLPVAAQVDAREGRAEPAVRPEQLSPTPLVEPIILHARTPEESARDEVEAPSPEPVATTKQASVLDSEPSSPSERPRARRERPPAAKREEGGETVGFRAGRPPTRDDF